MDKQKTDNTMDKTEFMRLALNAAKESAAEGEVPVGAVVVRNGEVVAVGRNRRESVKDALSHAEIEAIRTACAVLGGWRLWECEMYVTLEPCPMCAGAILNARIRKVTFGAYDQKKRRDFERNANVRLPLYPQASRRGRRVGGRMCRRTVGFF